MKINGIDYETIWFHREKKVVKIIDQTKLPHQFIIKDLKTVNEYINDNFESLYIDLGRYDINMSLMEFFDIMPQQGIPRVVILNKDKEVLNIKDTGEWTTARSRTKQEILNYFQEYKE